MAQKVGSLIISLALESGAFSSGLTDSERKLRASVKKMEQLGKGLQETGKSLTEAITLPLTAFAGFSIKVASDAAELQSAFNQTFGAMSGVMNTWAETTGNAMGRSTQEMQRAANTFGIFFNLAAPTKAAAADMAKSFAVLAQDLSSFYNVDPGEAIQKLRSGLAGEAEPLRDFGVFLTEASVQAKAMEMGLADANGAISEQAKIMARYQLIMEGTKNAQGDVARTSQGTANQIRASQAAWEELQVTVGTKLLPIITPLITKLGDLLNGFSQLPTPVQNTALALAAVAAAAGPITYVIGSLIKLTAPLSGAFALISGAGGLGAIGSTIAAIGGAVAPFIPVLAALAAVGAAIYANWDSIAPVLQETWAAIQEALGPPAQELVSAISDALTGLWRGPLGDLLRAVWPPLKELGKIVLEVFGVTLLGAIRGAAEIIGFSLRAIAATVRFLTNVFSVEFGQKVLGYIRSLYDGVKTWLLDKLNAVWDWVIGKLKLVGKAFYDLYDAVVGHSYVPDMVDGIAAEMARLDEVMVKPAERATAKTKASFEKLGKDVQALMGELFPEARALADAQGDLATLDRAIGAGGAGGYNTGQLEAARQRLIGGTGVYSFSDNPIVGTMAQLDSFSTQASDRMGQLDDVLADFAQRAQDRAQEVGVATVKIAKSFKDMATETLNALDRLAGAIKGGDVWDIISGVIGVGLQLGGAGLFGKSFQTMVNSVPKYAGGTSWHPGGVAMVGERGPELVNLPRGSQVIPNHALGGAGGTRVEVVPSPYFDVRVHENISARAPGIAQAGARGAEARLGWRQSRRVA